MPANSLCLTTQNPWKRENTISYLSSSYILYWQFSVFPLPWPASYYSTFLTIFYIFKKSHFMMKKNLIIFTKELLYLLDLIQTWFSPNNTIFLSCFDKNKSFLLFSNRLWYLCVSGVSGGQDPQYCSKALFPHHWVSTPFPGRGKLFNLPTSKPPIDDLL